MVFLSAVFRIVILDLVLSGDNAVVIGMAAHRLAPAQRRNAILIGGGGAIVLRITLTAVVALLLAVPGLRLAGGLVLIWIGFKLLGHDVTNDETSDKGVKAAASMRDAIVTILVADLVMSLDNVIAVAGASGGSLRLLLFGLFLSMAILMFMGNLVADLLNRFWWLSYVGSAVIAWTGADMVFKDPITMDSLGNVGLPIEYAAKGGIMLATLLLAHWFHRSRSGAPD